ncbi:MAG: glycine C-acetyltransferase [Spirochaetales bacterium]|nr:MAG: glycine C-acetyltransferase [Spirochaetales bacterium]
MYGSIQHRLKATLAEIRDAGLYKSERILEGPQRSKITVGGGREVINFCANNYLGLSNHPAVQAAAQEGLRKWGYGLSSVRFICGTQSIHKELEARLASFLGFDDAILYASAFDANGGLFETLLGPEDVIISDSLNHASIIDGVRLCKANRQVYANNDMADLESKLRQSASARTRMIATDGVFSMDGTLANLPAICDLADAYDSLVMVDDCHAVGFMGDGGRGTHEFHHVMGRVDVITGNLGKALGGANGGYTVGRKEIVELLRQRSRPYLFSNSVAPGIVAASLAAIELIQADPSIRNRLMENTRYFRDAIRKVGLNVPEGEHPIVPVMLGDAVLAHRMADMLLERGVYVVGFSFPVVPKGAARIRTQVSSAHTRDELDFTVEQFAAVKAELGL